MEGKRVILVTGANKGIGYEIVRALLRDTGDKILLGARDEIRGVESVAKLQAEFPDKTDNISLEIIDVANNKSRLDLAKRIASKFGKLDVVIHNAAIASYDPPGVEERAGPTFAVNYFGTFALNDALLPLLNRSQRPRIIIMTSKVAEMAFAVCSDKIKVKLSNYESVSEVDTAAEEFVKIAEENGKSSFDCLTSLGYGNVDIGMGIFFYTYSCSKLFVNARVKAMKSQSKYENLLLEIVCPGSCATDLTDNLGERTAEKGAETPAWLAMEDCEWLKSKEGQFYWTDKEQIPYFVQST